METKICTKCKTEKSINDFYPNIAMCKQCRSLGRKIYYQKNKEQFNQHYINNRDTILKYRKNYAKENKTKVQVTSQKYYQKNKNKINEKKRIYEKQKYQTDTLFRIKYKIRRNINISLKDKGYTKKSRTTDLLGCTFLEFKLYIESKFESWMNWGNHGLYNGELNYGWDFDHIVPLSTAKCETDIIKLNHYTNFQPLCSKINRDIKKNKVK